MQPARRFRVPLRDFRTSSHRPATRKSRCECGAVLILEPVEHGGRIAISARESGNELHVEVRNDGAPLDLAAKGGTGLSNIRERLHALYGDKARLVIEVGQPQGVLARIELPATDADSTASAG